MIVNPIILPVHGGYSQLQQVRARTEWAPQLSRKQQLAQPQQLYCLGPHGPSQSDAAQGCSQVTSQELSKNHLNCSLEQTCAKDVHCSTLLSQRQQSAALSPPRPINITSVQCELPGNEEKALQQVLSTGSRGVHPLICLLDDLTGSLAIWLGRARRHAAILLPHHGAQQRGREKCQTGHANTAVAGYYRACQTNASLLSQRKDVRPGEKRRKAEKRKGGRKVL